MAVALVAMFLLGMAVGTLIGPSMFRRKAAAGSPQRHRRRPATCRQIIRRSSGRIIRSQVVRVVDGDTFDARVSVWPGIEISTRVRLRGIDAPEMRARCKESRRGRRRRATPWRRCWPRARSGFRG